MFSYKHIYAGLYKAVQERRPLLIVDNLSQLCQLYIYDNQK
jgi:hypothetical protein